MRIIIHLAFVPYYAFNEVAVQSGALTSINRSAKMDIHKAFDWLTGIIRGLYVESNLDVEIIECWCSFTSIYSFYFFLSIEHFKRKMHSTAQAGCSGWILCYDKLLIVVVHFCFNPSNFMV